VGFGSLRVVAQPGMEPSQEGGCIGAGVGRTAVVGLESNGTHREGAAAVAGEEVEADNEMNKLPKRGPAAAAAAVIHIVEADMCLGDRMMEVGPVVERR
jgi:hypothetical protein